MPGLIDRIERWGRLSPDRVAHISGDRSLTYGELVRQSNAVATYLRRTLPDDGAPIAVQGHKAPEMLVAFLGAVRAGHPYIPIDTVLLPAQRVARILAVANAPMTLTAEQVAEIAADTDAADVSIRPASETGAYYIIFTSGSTGEPKGVVITHGCLASYLDWMLGEQGFVQQGETFLNQAPFSFDLSVMDMYCSLATGGTLFSLSQSEIDNPARLYQTLPQSNVSVWVSTPSFAQLCLAERTFTDAMLPYLRKFLFCGETLPPETAAALLDRFPHSQVWNTYGPTETTVATASIQITRETLARYRPLPVGRPKPDSRVLVVDGEGQPVADGVRGEIVIAGPNVSTGYLNRPALTAQAFFEWDGQRAYRTGDWGRYQDGLLFCEGRRDFQIKLHGHRIELGDIESHLQALPGIRDGAIIPKLKDGHAEWLAAFVIFHQRPDGTEFEIGQDLRRQLAQRLPAYMLPRKFYFLPTFPLTANGKVDRQKLAELIA